jgi:hypothetical protein
MSNIVYPPEFWTVVDKARERAEQSEIWNLSEMHRLFALEQAGVSTDFENKLAGAHAQQQMLMLFELYQLMVVSCETSCSRVTE